MAATGSQLTCYSFNAGVTCCTVSTKSELMIFSCLPIERRFKDSSDGYRVAELLLSTSLIALVPSGENPGSSPRKLKLWNSTSRQTIAELSFTSGVLSCCLNKHRIVVSVDSNEVNVFDLPSMKCLQILPSHLLSRGVVSLSNESTSLVALPGAACDGEIVLFDSIIMKVIGKFSAHKAPINNISFNASASLMATSSKTGTVIRVHSVPSAELLYVFRRGITRGVDINSLSFCPKSQLLSAGSASGTVHIFLLSGPPSLSRESNYSSAGILHGGDCASRGATSQHGEALSSENTSTSCEPKKNSAHQSSAPSISIALYAQAGDAANEKSATNGNVFERFGRLARDSFQTAAGYAYAAEKFLLPPAAREYMDSTRAICLCRVPQPGGVDSTTTLGASGSISSSGSSAARFRAAISAAAVGSLKVVVVTESGYLYRFAVPSMSELLQSRAELHSEGELSAIANDHDNDTFTDSGSHDFSEPSSSKKTTKKKPVTSSAGIPQCPLEDEAFILEQS